MSPSFFTDSAVAATPKRGGTFKQAMTGGGEKSKSAAKQFLKTVLDIKSDGNQTVIFELSDGSADFPFIMADYHLTIFPDGT